MNPYISIAEIAAEMQRSPGTIRRWLREKRLAATKEHGKWVVLHEDYVKDVRDRPQTP